MRKFGRNVVSKKPPKCNVNMEMICTISSLHNGMSSSDQTFVKLYDTTCISILCVKLL